MGHSFLVHPTMKTFVVLASLLALVIAKDLDCKGPINSTFIKDYKLTITNQGGKMAMNFNANVIKALPKGTKVKISVVSKGKKVPCKKVPGIPIKLGSCSYDLQKLLNSKALKPLLTAVAPTGQAKSLPLKPG